MGPLANQMAADLLRKLWNRLKEKAASRKEAAQAAEPVQPAVAEIPVSEEKNQLD